MVIWRRYIHLASAVSNLNLCQSSTLGRRLHPLFTGLTRENLSHGFLTVPRIVTARWHFIKMVIHNAVDLGFANTESGEVWYLSSTCGLKRRISIKARQRQLLKLTTSTVVGAATIAIHGCVTDITWRIADVKTKFPGGTFSYGNGSARNRRLPSRRGPDLATSLRMSKHRQWLIRDTVVDSILANCSNNGRSSICALIYARDQLVSEVGEVEPPFDVFNALTSLSK